MGGIKDGEPIINHVEQAVKRTKDRAGFPNTASLALPPLPILLLVAPLIQSFYQFIHFPAS